MGELAYGEGVTAYAKISGRASKRAPIFFCNISELRLRKILREGDGGPIPTQTLIKGLFVAGPSRFKLLNVKLFSNGSVNVIVDEDSAVASAPM